MRLIDADELLTAFPVDDELTLTKSCVRMTIQHMPTIEPQPDVPDTNVGDTISRKAAIDAINRICPVDTEYDCTLLDRVDVRYVLSDLPSAQPERIRGRWEMKPDPYGFFDEIPVCSECGCTTEMRKVYKFCPFCGADMRGE